MAKTKLTAEERTRYARQLIVKSWGEAAQERLKASRVGIAGAGGLGSPVSTYLTAAGVGALVFCDDQEVELSNLNRQVLYSEDDIGRVKSRTAAERLARLNPGVTIDARVSRITEATVPDLFSGCDLIIDCLDNWTTRFVLNRYCVEREVPLIHGGIKEYWGQIALLQPPETACLACFVEASDGEPGPIPVVGAVAGAIGSLMALTALRYLGQMEDPGPGVLRFMDLEDWEVETVSLRKRPDCPVCGIGGFDGSH